MPCAEHEYCENADSEEGFLCKAPCSTNTGFQCPWDTQQGTYNLNCDSFVGWYMTTFACPVCVDDDGAYANGPNGCPQCTPGCLAENEYAQVLESCDTDSPQVIQRDESQPMYAYVILDEEMLNKANLVVHNCKSDIDVSMCASLEFIEDCTGVDNRQHVDDNANLAWQSAHNVDIEKEPGQDFCQYYEALDLFEIFNKEELKVDDIIYLAAERQTRNDNEHTWSLKCGDANSGNASPGNDNTEEDTMECSSVPTEEVCDNTVGCRWTSNSCSRKNLRCTEEPIVVQFGPETEFYTVNERLEERELDYSICKDKTGEFGKAPVRFPCREFSIDLGRKDCQDKHGLIFVTDSTVPHLSMRIVETYDRTQYAFANDWDFGVIDETTYKSGEDCESGQQCYSPPIVPNDWAPDTNVDRVAYSEWKKRHPAIEISGGEDPALMDQARNRRMVKVQLYINDTDNDSLLTCPEGFCRWDDDYLGGQFTLNYQCSTTMLEACEASMSGGETDDEVLTEVQLWVIPQLRDAFNDFFNTNPSWEFTLPSILRFMFHDSVMVDLTEEDSLGSGCLRHLMPGAIDGGTTCDAAHSNLEMAVDVLDKLDTIFRPILSDSVGREVRLSWPDHVVLSAALAVDRAMPIEDYQFFSSSYYLSSRVGFGRPEQDRGKCSTTSMAKKLCSRIPGLKSEGNSWSSRMPPNHREILEKMERDGLTAEDVVAFMGAHTFGFQREFGWEKRDGFAAGPWTTTPTEFNSEYFHILLSLSNKYMEELENHNMSLEESEEEEVQVFFNNEPCRVFSAGLDPTIKKWESATNWCQLFGTDAPKVDSITGCRDKYCPVEGCVDGEFNGEDASDCTESFDTHTIMLDSDLAMIITGDETTEGAEPNRYLPFVEAFAKNQIKFFVQFQKAFLKWSELGVRVTHPNPMVFDLADLDLLHSTTNAPSVSPTVSPTKAPTRPVPTFHPSTTPSEEPTTSLPSKHPVAGPTHSPSTTEPSEFPSQSPVVDPIVTASIEELSSIFQVCAAYIDSPHMDRRGIQVVASDEVQEDGYCYQHVRGPTLSDGDFCRFSTASHPLVPGSHESRSTMPWHKDWKDCARECAQSTDCKAFGHNPTIAHNFCALYTDYPDRVDSYPHKTSSQCWFKQADSSTVVGLRSLDVLFRGKGRCANGNTLLSTDRLGFDVTGSNALSSVEGCEAACRQYNTGPRQCFAFSFSRRYRCDLHLQPATNGLESTTTVSTGSNSHNHCYQVVYRS